MVGRRCTRPVDSALGVMKEGFGGMAAVCLCSTTAATACAPLNRASGMGDMTPSWGTGT